MQVAVRSSSPVPKAFLSQSFRHSTEIGLGSVSPPNLLPKSSGSRVSNGSAAKGPVADVKTSDSQAPPSSLKVDVDVVPPSADAVLKDASTPTKASDISEDDELVNGFPLSEAPTVARKPPPEPTRRVVLKESSSDEPLSMPSLPPKGRQRVVWLAAAAIVIAGTIGAARLVRTDKRPRAAGFTSALHSTASRGSVTRLDATTLADAGHQSVAAADDEEQSALSAEQLEQKLAEDLARATGAVDSQFAGKAPGDLAKRTSQKATSKLAVTHTARLPAKPADKAATQVPAKSGDNAPPKPTENKSKPANSIGSEYGI
jgi:hypothetical protein